MILRSRNHGFTLVEIMIVLVIMGVGSTILGQQYRDKTKERSAAMAIDRTEEVLNQARNYRSDFGSWPSSINTLVTAGYITSEKSKSFFNTDYTVSTVGADSFRLSFDTKDKFYAGVMKGRLPNATKSNTTVSTDVTPAAHDLIVNDLLPRDGSRDMTGDLGMGGNDINNVDKINTKSIDTDYADVTTQLTFKNAWGDFVSIDDIRGEYIQSAGDVVAKKNIYADENITAQNNVYAKDVWASEWVLGKNIAAGEQLTFKNGWGDYFRSYGDITADEKIGANRFIINDKKSVGDSCSEGEFSLDTTTSKLLVCDSGTSRLVLNSQVGESLAASSGYQQVGSMYFQWGSSNVLKNSTKVVTLPKEFTNQCFQVIANFSYFPSYDIKEGTVSSRCTNQRQIQITSAENETTDVR